jgi:histidinol phosphatase-like PHP family hydrolase
VITPLFEQCDLHVHTSLSPCAMRDMHIRSIIDAADECGVRYLGLTDHIAEPQDSARVGITRRELESVKKPMEVFVGCEADIIDVGKQAVTREIRAEVDFVAVAANHFHARTVAQPEDESYDAVKRHFLAMLNYACSLEWVDVIVHPLNVFPGTFDPTFLELMTDDELAEPIELAVKNGIAFEISPRALLDRAQIYFRLRFLGLCKEAGLKFSIGSDAHRLDAVGQTRVLAPIIRELGLTDDDIWLPRRRYG